MKYRLSNPTLRTVHSVPLHALLLYLLFSHHIYAQTYLYKRIAIINNDNRRMVNDDAHYLTFNSKGCYESDASGFSDSQCFLKFIKDENNLHCFYGTGFYGQTHYYFSCDYSRLNIQADNTVYVYLRETNGKTTALKRKQPSQANNNTTTKPSTDIMPSMSSVGGSLEITSGSSGKHKRTCPYCHGSGRLADQITYSPNYTGENNTRYCSTCGKFTDAHFHHQPLCRTCYGKGYVE